MSDKTKPEELKLMTREQVSAELAPTEGLTFTDLKPGDDIAVQFSGTKDEPVVNLGGTELRIHPQAMEDSGHCVGMLSGYVRKCPASLLHPHLNYWFGEGMSEPVRAVAKDNVLLRMTKERVKTKVVENERLLRLAEERIGVDHILGFHQVYASLDNTVIPIVLDKAFEPVNNDTLFGGIRITNSIMGKDTVRISPYVFRQCCSNGAIAERELGHYTRKKHDSLEDWVAEIIGSAESALDLEFECIKHLTEISVKGHVAEVVHGLGKELSLPGKLVEQVRDAAFSQNAESMYDIYNAFSRVATHGEDLTFSSIHRLQRAAGWVTKKHKLCKTCHRVLN